MKLTDAQPRITGVDECHNFSKTLRTSQMLLFWPPLLSGSYNVWGGTHATDPLKTKIIYITFPEMHETTCFAL